MVTSITRNWVGGLTSGMDTQGLIDKMMTAERIPMDRLEQKRGVLTFQKSLLQEVNLKLFELQNKATDLTFSRTFNTKKVSSTNDRAVSGSANTSAKVGSYTLRIKQLATATKVGSATKLAGPLETGHSLQSVNPLGGSSTELGSIGVTPGDLQVSVFGGGSYALNLGSLTPSSSAAQMVSAVNSQINNVAELKGKVVASFDDKNNQVKFNLLDNTKSITVADGGVSNIVNKMFDVSGAMTLTGNVPVKGSDLVQIRSGGEVTLGDLGIDITSKITLTRGASTMTLNLSGLTAASTVSEAITALNRQIDTNGAFVKGGVATGNPDLRLLDFRFNSDTRKLQAVNTDSTDIQAFSLTDDTVAAPASNFTLKLFGGSGPVMTTPDMGKMLVSETFPTPVSSGNFTIDGVKISINSQTDNLQGVLSRITSSTSLNASYDSGSDTIRLTRKDGSTGTIGLGGSSDTSNFLSVTGLISGSQAGAAAVGSSANLGLTTIQASTAQLGTLSPPLAAPVNPGILRLTVNGVSSDVSYAATDTLNQVLDRVKQIGGVDEAFYDESTQRVSVRTARKGSSATLKIEDAGGGNLASVLNLPISTAVGSSASSSLESSHPISNVQTAATLDKAGFATTITSGNFTINGVNFNIANPATATLDSLLTAINNNTKVGVKAEFDSSRGAVTLTSMQTGNSSIALGSASDTSNFLSALGLNTATQEVGQNAIFSVDGLSGGADQVRQSNQVSDIADGVTFTLKEVTGSAGETVSIAADTEVARKAIDDFIKTYNESIDMVTTRLSEKHNYQMEALTDVQKKSMSADEIATYESQFQIGLLGSDSTLSMARSRMRVVVSGVVKSVDKAFDSLSDLGISTGVVGSNYQDTQSGILKVVDEGKLNSALSDNPDKVAELFAKDSTTESSMGIARRLKGAMNEFTKSDGMLTRRVGRSGITSSNSEMDKQILLINDQITKQQDRLTNRENALIKQFADLETAMSRYQTQSQAFASQLSQMTGGR